MFEEEEDEGEGAQARRRAMAEGGPKILLFFEEEVVEVEAEEWVLSARDSRSKNRCCGREDVRDEGQLQSEYVA